MRQYSLFIFVNFSSKDVDNRRRLSEIKIELQSLMRQKKKYDEDKLKQDAEFLQSEIHDLKKSIVALNNEIKTQSQTKMKLVNWLFLFTKQENNRFFKWFFQQIEMTNLRSRSRIRWTNLTSALKEKRFDWFVYILTGFCFLRCYF